MRTTDIIRNILDLIDQVDTKVQDQEQEPTAEIEVSDDSKESRFKQIVAMLSNRDSSGYENTPNEIVSGVDSVTKDAGGGLNGPKHPADIRVKDPRGFE